MITATDLLADRIAATEAAYSVLRNALEEVAEDGLGAPDDAALRAWAASLLVESDAAATLAPTSRR